MGTKAVSINEKAGEEGRYVIYDRRVKRTQQLLAKALIAMTLEKGYEAVTIRDITERADIGYATFFRHYHTKEELLQAVLDVVLAELTELLHPLKSGSNAETMGELLFRYVEQHSEVVRVLLDSHSLLERSIKTIAQEITNEQAEMLEGLIPAEIAAYHIITSSIALIKWWLDHEMPYSTEQMGSIYYELITRPTSSAVARCNTHDS